MGGTFKEEELKAWGSSVLECLALISGQGSQAQPALHQKRKKLHLVTVYLQKCHSQAPEQDKLLAPSTLSLHTARRWTQLRSHLPGPPAQKWSSLEAKVGRQV